MTSFNEKKARAELVELRKRLAASRALADRLAASLSKLMYGRWSMTGPTITEAKAALREHSLSRRRLKLSRHS